MPERKLLDARDCQLIDELSLAAKRRTAGLIVGEQRSPVQGGGIEFADYRAYQPGDDVRRIDWAVFLRLRKLFVKLCAEEKEHTLVVMLDISRSMQFGRPEKLWTAMRLAALLAGVALHDGNRAGVVTIGPHLGETLGVSRSRSPLTSVADAIARIEPAAATDPIACAREFAARYGRRVMLVCISDLLFQTWPQFLGGLAASGCEGYIVQMLAPEELNPPYLGEVTLVDLEGAGEVSLHISRETARLYQREMALYLQEVQRACSKHGLWHTAISTAWTQERILRQELRRGGPLC